MHEGTPMNDRPVNLNEIIQLSAELNTVQDLDLLLDKILTEARRILNADAGIDTDQGRGRACIQPRADRVDTAQAPARPEADLHDVPDQAQPRLDIRPRGAHRRDTEHPGRLQNPGGQALPVRSHVRPQVELPHQVNAHHSPDQQQEGGAGRHADPEFEKPGARR